MKRIVSMVLSVCLFAGLILPTTVMATDVTILDTVDITGIQIPVIGEVPSIEGVQAENCEVVISWENDYGDAVEQFEAGQGYTVHVELYPAEGFAFREDTVITIDGEYPNIYFYAEPEYGYLAQRYSFCELIETVEVELAPVEVGLPVPRSAIIPEDANYTAELQWYVWDREEAYFVEFEGETFLDGNMYSLEVAVYPDEGYEFDEEKTVLVMDGDPTVYCWDSGMIVEMIYAFGANDLVEKVELVGVELPQIGNLANTDNIQTAEDANYELIGAVWMESATGDIDSADWEEAKTFQAGKYYALVIMVLPADGYMFGENAPLYINGQEMQPDVRESTAYSDLSVLLFEVNESAPEQTPGETPEQKPEDKPEELPEQKPEEKPEKVPEADTPATGDGFMWLPLMALMMLSAAGILVVVAWKKHTSL